MQVELKYKYITYLHIFCIFFACVMIMGCLPITISSLNAKIFTNYLDGDIMIYSIESSMMQDVGDCNIYGVYESMEDVIYAVDELLSIHYEIINITNSVDVIMSDNYINIEYKKRALLIVNAKYRWSYGYIISLNENVYFISGVDGCDIDIDIY